LIQGDVQQYEPIKTLSDFLANFMKECNSTYIEAWSWKFVNYRVICTMEICARW